MAIITLVSTKKVDGPGRSVPTVGGGQRKYLQTTEGGGNPGKVTVGDSEEAISFGDLVSPALVRLENLSDSYDVTYGPESGGAMVPLGTLRRRVMESGAKVYDGGIAVFEVSPGVTLRMQAVDPADGEGSSSGSGSPSADVQVDAEDL